MAEYIEREALREAFIKHFDAVYDDGKLVFSDHICTAEDCEDILKLVAELPTADVVPVVRCKDCKFYEPYKKPVEDFDGECIARDCETDETDFCNYGERRGEE
jgi:hypothetical protein